MHNYVIFTLSVLLLCACTHVQQPSAHESQLAFLINQQRTEFGERFLNKSEKLNKAARAHAADMHSHKYFSHISKNGDDFWQRIIRQGYEPCFAAENIAEGQTSATQTLKDWTKSKGHLQNTLTPKATESGVGHVGSAWVALYARPC